MKKLNRENWVPAALIASAAVAAGSIGISLYTTPTKAPQQVVAATPTATPEPSTSCFGFSPPLLFDTSDNGSADPGNPRVHGLTDMSWYGQPLIAYSDGNEIALQKINDPLDPGPPKYSRFKVPPAGDRDYGLFGFSVCDDCRYVFAGYEMQGAVIADIGTNPYSPMWTDFKYFPQSGNVGGFTYKSGDAQYLVAMRLPGGTCPASNAVLWRIDGTDTRAQIACLGEYTVSGGLQLDATNVLLGDTALRLRGYTVQPGGLVSTGVVLDGRLETQHGASYDHSTHMLATVVYGVVKVWDMSQPTHPRLVISQNTGSSRALLCALKWPYLWVGQIGGSVSRAFSVANGTSLEEIGTSFWDPTMPWNSYNYQGDEDALFTGGGGFLFVSRFSVLERFAVSDACLNPSSVFRDGFESGGATFWTERIP